MRVLVTGATTPLGRALIRALLADPAVERVLAVAREPAPALVEPRVDVAQVDLSHARAVHDLLWGPARHLGITAVVHGPLGRHEVGRADVESTRELLRGCAGHPTIARFVLRSVAEVYAVRAREPTLLDEEAPLDLDPAGSRWQRHRLESDLIACAHLATPGLAVTILRCAEIVAPEVGSQLWDYLSSRVCLRPLGFDPMINVLSIDDAVAAIRAALAAPSGGIYNIAGADTLPLSALIAEHGRLGVPLPGPLLTPLYHLRTRAVGFEFRYEQNGARFHFGGVLDGTRARAQLGYAPATRS